MVNWLLFHPTVGRHRKKQTAKKRCICSSCIFLFSLAWNTNFVSKFQPLKVILTTDTWLYSYLLTDNLIVLFTLEIKACLKISCSVCLLLFFFPVNNTDSNLSLFYLFWPTLLLLKGISFSYLSSLFKSFYCSPK